MIETKSAYSVTSHNGTFTVENPASGQHRTFRIKTQHEDALFAPGKRILSLLIGPDNTGDFKGFAFVDGGGVIRLWNKHRGTQFERLARLVQNLDAECARHGLTAEWSVKCRRCNRELTTPESIRSGIGPTCEGR